MDLKRLFLALLFSPIFALAQNNVAPFNTSQINSYIFVGQSGTATIQAAVTKACAVGTHMSVILPPAANPADTIAAAAGCTNVWIVDQRTVNYAPYVWNGSSYVFNANLPNTFNGYYTPAGAGYTGDICQRWAQANSIASSASLTTIKVDLTGFTGANLCSVNPAANMGSIVEEEVILPAASIFLLTQFGDPGKVRLRGVNNLNGLTGGSIIVACNTSQIQAGPQPCGSSFVPAVNATSSSNSSGTATVTTLTAHGAAIGTIIVLEGNGNDLDSAWKLTSIPSGTQLSFTYPGSNTISGARVINVSSMTTQCGNWLGTNQTTTPPYTDWVSSNAYTSGQLIVPLLNNTAGYIYQVTVAGTSGAPASEPNPWNQTVGGTQVDNGVTWTNLGQSCVATVTLAANHGLLAGGFPVTFTSTGTVLDGNQYVYTINPAGNAAAFTVMYYGAPFTIGAVGTATITPRVTIPIYMEGTTLIANSAGVDQGATCEYCTIDANDLPNSVAVFSTTANEGSGIWNSMIRNASRRGYWITKTSNGFAANWSDGFLQIYTSQTAAPANNATVANSIPVVGYDVYAASNPAHAIHDMTIRPLANRNPSMDGMQIAGLTGGQIYSIHCEIERNCIHFSGRSQSAGISITNLSPGFGQVGNPGQAGGSGAGIYNALIRNDSSAAVWFKSIATVLFQSPYQIDDSQGGHSFAGGVAIPDSFCSSYELGNTTSNPNCSLGTAEHQLIGPMGLFGAGYRLRTGAGTFEGAMFLDGANNVDLSGSSGTLNICPFGGSTCSGSGGIRDKINLSSSGAALENDAGTFAGTTSVANITANRTWSEVDFTGNRAVAAHVGYTWTVSATNFVTLTTLGGVYYSAAPETIAAVEIRLSGASMTCSVAPSAVILDLGTAPSTAYGSATILQTQATGTVIGVYGNNALSIAVTAGHYLGFGFSAGTCTTPPQFDATISLK